MNPALIKITEVMFLSICLYFIIFGDVVLSQFTSLSSTSILSNNAHSRSSNYRPCNTQAWYSDAEGTNIFMITFIDETTFDYVITSNLISFSPSPSYSYYIQSDIAISNTSFPSVDIDSYLVDVAQSHTSILILGRYYDDILYDDTYIFYVLLDNYKEGDVQKNQLKQIRINPSNADPARLTATKLFNTNNYVIIYEYNDDFYYFLVDELSNNFLSTTPTFLETITQSSPSWQSRYPIKARSSKVTERYLLIWGLDGSDTGLAQSEVYGTVRRNDGTVFKSTFIINIGVTEDFQYPFDLIAFNISDSIGFWAVLYHDKYDSVNQRLWISILDDFGAHLFDDDLMFAASGHEGDDIQSAELRSLDIVANNKIYLVCSWSYDDDINDGAVYMQLFEFSWSTVYNLTTIGEPQEITSSSTQNPVAVCIGSIGNEILTAWIYSPDDALHIELLSADITTTTKQPNTDEPTKTPITELPTNNVPSTKLPTKIPTNNVLITEVPTNNFPITEVPTKSTEHIDNESIAATAATPTEHYTTISTATNNVNTLLSYGVVLSDDVINTEMLIVFSLFCVLLLALSVVLLCCKTFQKQRESGRGGWDVVWRFFAGPEKIGILLEMFDFVTDCLFGIDLITGYEGIAELQILGAVSIITSILGSLVFLGKIVLVRTSFKDYDETVQQFQQYKLEKNEDKANETVSKIRTQKWDLVYLDWLAVSVEDLVQVFIVITVRLYLGEWTTISIITLTITGFSLGFKLLLKPILTACNLCDPPIKANNVSYIGEVESIIKKYCCCKCDNKTNVKISGTDDESESSSADDTI